MNRMCLQRQLWIRLSAWIAAAGCGIFVGTVIWINLLKPEALTRLTLIQAVCWLLLGVGLGCTGSIITAFLRLTDSPALSAALRFLETPTPTQLRVVEAQDTNTRG